MHDTNEWLLVSSEGTITYNRRIARVGRVSLQYELKDKVAEFLKVYDDRACFPTQKDTHQILYRMRFERPIE